MNGSPTMVTRLLNHLSPSAIATVVNANGTWLTRLIGFLDPAVITQASSASEAFMEGLMANLDETVVGSVVNQNGNLLMQLLNPYPHIGLSAATIAGAINANPGFLEGIIANTNAATMAAMQHNMHLVQGSRDLIGRIFEAINGTPVAVAAIATAINHNPTFLSDMMGYSGNTPIIADLINYKGPTGTAGIVVVPDGLIMQLLQPVGSGWLDPSVLAGAMGAHPEATGALLAHLDPTVVSTAINLNPNLIPDLLAIVPTSLVTDTMLSGDNHLMKHLELHVKAKAKILFWIASEANLWTESAVVSDPQ